MVGIVLTYWKVISIALTGAFGILALLTRYKDNNGNITKWGQVSLIGILFSTAMGIIAQFKETNDAQARNAANLKEAQKSIEQTQRIAEQTQRIVEQTQLSVENQERLLQAIDSPGIFGRFTVPCDKFAAFCTAVRSLGDNPKVEQYQAIWSKWPTAGGAPSDLVIYVQLNRPNKTVIDFGGKDDWSLFYLANPLVTAARSCGKDTVLFEYLVPKDSVIAADFYGDVQIAARLLSPTTQRNAGVFQSLRDLKGATFTISVSAGGVALMPVSVSLLFSAGRRVLLDKFQRRNSNAYTAVVEIQDPR